MAYGIDKGKLMIQNLTPRQERVLQELRKGLSNKEIARVLDISDATVKIHLTEVFKRLGVKTRCEAILKCSVVKEQHTETSLSDKDILEEFVDMAMADKSQKWSQRVVKFGHAVNERARRNIENSNTNSSSDTKHTDSA